MTMCACSLPVLVIVFSRRFGCASCFFHAQPALPAFGVGAGVGVGVSLTRAVFLRQQAVRYPSPPGVTPSPLGNTARVLRRRVACTVGGMEPTEHRRGARGGWRAGARQRSQGARGWRLGAGRECGGPMWQPFFVAASCVLIGSRFTCPALPPQPGTRSGWQTVRDPSAATTSALRQSSGRGRPRVRARRRHSRHPSVDALLRSDAGPPSSLTPNSPALLGCRKLPPTRSSRS